MRTELSSNTLKGLGQEGTGFCLCYNRNRKTKVHLIQFSGQKEAQILSWVQLKKQLAPHSCHSCYGFATRTGRKSVKETFSLRPGKASLAETLQLPRSGSSNLRKQEVEKAGGEVGG